MWGSVVLKIHSLCWVMSGSVDVHTYLYNLLTILRSKGLNHSGGGSLMAEVPKHLVVMESHVKYFPCYEKALLVEKKIFICRQKKVLCYLPSWKTNFLYCHCFNFWFLLGHFYQLTVKFTLKASLLIGPNMSSLPHPLPPPCNSAPFLHW